MGHGFNIEVVFTGPVGPVTCDAVVIDMDGGLIDVTQPDLKAHQFGVRDHILGGITLVILFALILGIGWLLVKFVPDKGLGTLLAASVLPIVSMVIGFTVRQADATSEPPRELLR